MRTEATMDWESTLKARIESLEEQCRTAAARAEKAESSSRSHAAAYDSAHQRATEWQEECREETGRRIEAERQRAELSAEVREALEDAAWTLADLKKTEAVIGKLGEPALAKFPKGGA